jgi:hypothetical protein
MSNTDALEYNDEGYSEEEVKILETWLFSLSLSEILWLKKLYEHSTHGAQQCMKETGPHFH